MKDRQKAPYLVLSDPSGLRTTLQGSPDHTGEVSRRMPCLNLEAPPTSVLLMAVSKPTSQAGSSLLVLIVLLLLSPLAGAHTTEGSVGGFVSGFQHPLTGLDHIVAMVAVGLWGAFLGGRAMWTLPVIFPVVMAFGGALGILGVPIPHVETGIALSGIALGLMVAFAAKPPLWVAGVMVGFFAVFHGHAHGTELPESANAMTFAIGFVVSTGLLHLGGIAFGLLVHWPWGRVTVRALGSAIAAVGFAFLFKLL